MKLHRVMSLLFAFSVGIMLAYFAFRWATDFSTGRDERARQEAVVMEVRQFLNDAVGAGRPLTIIDPLEQDRAVGKGYIYPTAGNGWQVSGYYRRDAQDRWHPFMATLDAGMQLVSLAMGDDEPGLVRRAATDPRLTATDSRGLTQGFEPDSGSRDQSDNQPDQ